VAVIDGFDMSELERRARDPENGTIQKVPAEMNYSIWTSYSDKVRHEPEITAVVNDVARNLGVPLAGLENRLKTEKSFTRKAKDDAVALGISEVQAADNISDAIRYTALLDKNSFLVQYEDFIDALNSQGIEILKVKNTFRKGEPYKGVNVKVRSRDGVEFEIQFHTEQSYEIKEKKLHKLYEEYRKEDTPREKATRLRRQMIAISDTIELPKGVEDIG
jgi:hypothetical protein